MNDIFVGSEISLRPLQLSSSEIIFKKISNSMDFLQEWLPIIRMDNVPAANRPYILATRVGLWLIFLALAVMVKMAWRKRKIRGKSI